MMPDLKAPISNPQPPHVEELLKEASTSGGMISFAGALPSSRLFPSEELEEVFTRTMAEHSGEALQYNWCEGYAPLREQIAELMRNRGVDAQCDQILVTHGAQQALSLISTLAVHPGDTVVAESPTYAAAIPALRLQSPRLECVERDANGLDFENLRDMLRTQNPKLLYVIPTGHNPIGGSLDTRQRERLIELTADSHCVLVEDDAYGDLQYVRNERPLKSRPNTDHILYVGSFSKTLSPGLRVGWVAGPATVIAELSKIKQAADLQTGSLNQLTLSSYLKSHPLQEHIQRCVAVYRQRRESMLHALRKHFPGAAKWSAPDAGFSVWIELPEQISAEALLPLAMQRGVAFDPGRPNFPCVEKTNYLRLSYSNQEAQKIETGIEILGKLIAELM
jgi:2-aminoadipate transaminase